MIQPKSFLNSTLLFALILISGITAAQSDCTEIKATIEVVQSGEKSSLKIDFHGQRLSSFEITLMGAKGFFKKDIQEQEVKNLDQGRYIIVFSPKREEDGFCLKHIEFTIK